jgi:hypothetical protein
VDSDSYFDGNDKSNACEGYGNCRGSLNCRTVIKRHRPVVNVFNSGSCARSGILLL